MTSTHNSVVLGAFERLPPRYIEPFARSLRSTEFAGTFRLVTAGYGADDLRLLASVADDIYEANEACVPPTGPTVVPFLQLLRRTRGVRRLYPLCFQVAARAASERHSLARWIWLERNLEGLQALRYLHYYRYLTTKVGDADLVMLTDVRDVVFQRDPFERAVHGLELVLEESHVVVGRDHFNTRWIRDLYGPESAAHLEGARVSCSGTVIGQRAAILHYLTEMILEIMWRRRPMGAHDQGVHNWLLRTGRLPLATLVANGSGRVLTMGAMRSYETSSEGYVLNSDGSVPAVLHQYDRHKELQERFCL